MRLSSKPISSPGRADKFPPPLTRFLRSNVGSRSRGRSRSSPMFVRKKNASAGVETQEPSSPKVTCIGQVRVRRSKQAGVKPSRSRTTAPKRRFRWIRKAFVCNYSTRKIKPKSSCSCSRPIWRRWFLFFQVGYRRNVDSAKDTTVGESKIEEEINGDSDRVDEDEEVEEDRAKVSISSPPKNALLLMRSRSAPYRASSLANRFWGSPSRIEDAANENKVQETQDREEKEERPTSGIEVICRDSAAESRKCPETEEKLGFSDEFQSSSSDPSTKTTGISILQPQLMEGEYPRPLVLTRSKSEPAARITTRRFDPETEVSFWKKRRLRLGLMENSPANQLPEVDSLPDGFVEISAEEKNDADFKDADYKDTLSELDLSSDSRHELVSASADSSAAVEGVRLTDCRAEMTEKTRTFPVTLSEKDSLDACSDSLESSEKVSVGDCVDGSVMHEMANSAAESPEKVSSSYHELTTDPSHIEGDCQISDRSTEGCSELQATNLKERSAVENTESQRNRKPETAEGKRKSGKRSLKSEKEFLEFTLKYQHVLAERDAAIAVRNKLESLCRELQRQNKILMDECKRVSTEGQNIRQDLSTKFHDAIKDVSSKLEEQKDECLSQLKENETLRNKLKLLSDQYAITEQQFNQKLKQKALELQIADLKLQQHEEKLMQEQSQMKLYAEQVSQLLATEKNLRLQLAADGEKFQQFQDALSKSNEVFETFKQEIEKMAKSIKELKKENIFLKSKCEKSDFTLIELVDEREHMKKQLEKMKNQKEKLESLCRSLQAERKQVSVGSNNAGDIPDQVKMGSSAAES